MIAVLAVAVALGGNELRAEIKDLWPSDDAYAWMRVGWTLDLWEARRRSQREGKPMLLWMMNGHPTGCT